MSGNRPSGDVYVMWRKTREEALEQLKLYRAAEGSVPLKAVQPMELNHECNFGMYPDGAYMLVNAAEQSQVVKDLQKALIESSKALTKASEEIEDLHSRLEEKDDEVETLEEQIEELGATAEELQYTAECAEDAVIDIENEAASILEENRSLENQVSGLELDLRDTQDDLVETEKKLTQAKARVAELELLLTCPEIQPMTDTPLSNSHDDLPSMEEMVNNLVNKQVQKTLKKVKGATCGVCNKTLKDQSGVQNHQRSTKCGQVLAKAMAAEEMRSRYQPVDGRLHFKSDQVLLAEVNYKRDVMKFQLYQTCIRWISTAAALSTMVYHIV